LKAIAAAILIAGGVYFMFAYEIMPELWFWRYGKDTIASQEMLTVTPQGIPGDPINVGLVGSKGDVLHAFHAADWDPADAITLESSVEIGVSVVLDRPDPDAPVSTLLFDGRRQDLAFEKPVGKSADERHHIRLWLTKRTGEGGGPLWLASGSFDRGVGLSHDTGQITHHIGPDLDAERDTVIDDLAKANVLSGRYQIEGRGPTKDGRNGGGDLYFTDGLVTVGILIPQSPK
jgi:LssY C-terminus